MFGKTLILFGAFFSPVLFAGTSAWAAPVAVHCGAPVNSTVVADSTSGTGISALTFQALPGARIVVAVPAGQTRCVKLHFSASVSCTGASVNFCVLEPRDNAVDLVPVREVNFDGGNDTISAARSFDWAKRIGPGNHNIVVRMRVTDAATQFLMNGWTMDVDVMK